MTGLHVRHQYTYQKKHRHEHEHRYEHKHKHEEHEHEHKQSTGTSTGTSTSTSTSTSTGTSTSTCEQARANKPLAILPASTDNFRHLPRCLEHFFNIRFEENNPTIIQLYCYVITHRGRGKSDSLNGRGKIYRMSSHRRWNDHVANWSE